MGARKIIITGTISGVIMGLTLFISGAILAIIIYGPQMAPEGKFEPSQMNPFYFFWTKLVIGIFFGILFTLINEKLPSSIKIVRPSLGLKYFFLFWLVLSLWNLSHPLIYGSINYADKIFWTLYTLFGFLSLGYILGLFYKRFEKKVKEI